MDGLLLPEIFQGVEEVKINTEQKISPGSLVRQNRKYLAHKFMSRMCGITDPENKSGWGYRSIIVDPGVFGIYIATESPPWNRFKQFDLVLFGDEKVYCPLGLIEAVS